MNRRQPHPAFTHPAWFGTMLALPWVLVLAAWAPAPPVQAGEVPPENVQRNRGTLRCDESFDFGYVAQDTRVSRVYMLRNVGDDTLFIQRVHASCGCTSAPLTKAVLAPGEKVPLEVTFSSGKFSGPVRKTVTVYSSDGNTPMRSLDFSATVGEFPDAVMVEPKGGIDLARFASTAGEAKAALTNLSPTGAQVRIVSTTPDFLEARLSTARVQPRQATDLIVKAKEGAPVGKFSGSVTLAFEGGLNARLSIPVSGERTAK